MAASDDAGRAYDLLAPRYDELLQHNVVLAHSAAVSLDLVSRAMVDRDLLLELGCGTGRETLPLLSLGKRIVSCDPSERALDVLRQKAQDLGLVEQVSTRCMPASGVGAIISEFGEHVFDGAFASFSLSYERDLSAVVELVWRAVRPHSPFLCTIFNRACLMEWILLAPLILPRRGLRRLEGRTYLPVDERAVTVRSYSVPEVRRVFAERFSLQRTWGVPAIIPPHYLHVLVDLARGAGRAWQTLDLRLNGVWPFKYLGSHTAFLFSARP